MATCQGRKSDFSIRCTLVRAFHSQFSLFVTSAGGGTASGFGGYDGYTGGYTGGGGPAVTGGGGGPPQGVDPLQTADVLRIFTDMLHAVVSYRPIYLCLSIMSIYLCICTCVSVYLHLYLSIYLSIYYIYILIDMYMYVTQIRDHLHICMVQLITILALVFKTMYLCVFVYIFTYIYMCVYTECIYIHE